MNPPIHRLTPLSVVLEALNARLVAAAPQETLVENAVGLCVAGNFRAAHDLPAAPVARESGWAVNCDDVVGATPYSPAILSSVPVWVDAGDYLPASANGVLAPDILRITTENIAEADDSVFPGQGVRAAGQDIAAGALLLGEGMRIEPRHVSLMQACGFKRVFVRNPRVRIVVATVAAAAHVEMVRTWINASGAAVSDLQFAQNDRSRLAASYSMTGADLVLSLGGVGQARGDCAVAALSACGCVDVHGIALRPGSDTAFGMSGGGFATILLPDRLDSLIAGMLTLVGPALSASARAVGRRWTTAAPLSVKVSSTIGLTELFLCLPAEPAANPVPLEGAEYAALAGATGWFAVPPGSEGMASGEAVQILPFQLI